MRPETLVFDELSLEPDSGLLRHRDNRVRILCPLDSKMLAIFFQSRGGFKNKMDLYNEMYWDVGESKEPGMGAIDARVSNMRRILRKFGYTFETSYGRGYRLCRVSVTSSIDLWKQ